MLTSIVIAAFIQYLFGPLILEWYRDWKAKKAQQPQSQPRKKFQQPRRQKQLR